MSSRHGESPVVINAKYDIFVIQEEARGYPTLSQSAGSRAVLSFSSVSLLRSVRLLPAS